MDSLVIRPKGPLNGAIPIAGAKNSAIKLMVAALLTDGKMVLHNVPDLADTRLIATLLREIGASVEFSENRTTCSIVTERIVSTEARYDLVRQMRATFNVLGPLVAREGQAQVSLPGGCAIGARPVDMHLASLKAMGADISLADGYVRAQAPRGLTGAEIHFPRVSVGATEHAMLAAVLADGRSVLDNAACEPEIADLAACLTAMGAQIEGAGSSRIRIDGVARLTGCEHRVMPDRIEAGAYAIAVAMTGGDVRLERVCGDDMQAVISHLAAAGASLEVTCDDSTESVRIRRQHMPPEPVDVETGPFPQFPTDLQAPFMALMTRCSGACTIRETIFENRFMHAPELSRLGADITVRGNEALVRGVRFLRGASVMATDLRASFSLIVAGLVARGETHVNRLYHLDRGFSHLEQKLNACGADIVRLSDRSDG